MKFYEMMAKTGADGHVTRLDPRTIRDYMMKHHPELVIHMAEERKLDAVMLGMYIALVPQLILGEMPDDLADMLPEGEDMRESGTDLLRKLLEMTENGSIKGVFKRLDETGLHDVSPEEVLEGLESSSIPPGILRDLEELLGGENG